ncbi:hypothetical protein [Antarctobacter jejuensis]|uniref:hypothetical protein n=1 Tax=Antarctobacter jejuensis TaxID=1439938 RepID=UPI003FD3CF75
MTIALFPALRATALFLCVCPAPARAQDNDAPDPQIQPAQQTPARPQSPDQRDAGFQAIMALSGTAPDQALTQMIALAETGDPKAQQQVGTFYRQGTGTSVDLPLAKLWYERAVAGGRDYALAPLARTEAALGNGEAAYALLHSAIEKGMPGAERQLGFAHIDKQLGRRSDPSRGLNILMGLIDGGDRVAARPLLLRYTWNRLPLPAPTRLVQMVEADGLAGDGPSAEAALVYLTKAERFTRGSLDRRQALIAVEGIRESILASERMLLAADTLPTQFFREADRIIATTPREEFPRAALTAYRISPNAYVRILQRELRAQGYYRGRVNGWLTSSTIAAHQRFCRDQGILDQCREGPRKTDTIRAVTEALAAQPEIGK